MVTQRVDWIAGCLALAVSALIGCDSGGLPDMVPIRGEVYYDGEPMKTGTVIYSPRGKDQGRQALPRGKDQRRQASGGIQPDGTFVLTTLKKGDGVIKGEYDISVYAMKPHPGEPKSREEVEAMRGSIKIKRGFLIPEKYTDPATSGLSDTVDKEHSGFKRIELSS